MERLGQDMAGFPWRAYLPGILAVVQVGLLALAAREGSRGAWLGALSLVALINLVAWLLALRNSRAITDTPTSHVASAAQGYVELIGTARPNDGVELASPLTQLPCIWYRYGVEEREQGKWRFVRAMESDQPFVLEDRSGRCTLDPSGAQIYTRHKEVRQEEDMRYTEHLLLKGDALYAIGEFRSTRGADREFDDRRDVGDLLGAWKEDQAELRRRFDLDGNGEIDVREWALAQLAARREVERQRDRIRSESARNYMGKPAGGRLYLITNQPPEAMDRRFSRLALLHLVLLVVALLAMGWAMKLA